MSTYYSNQQWLGVGFHGTRRGLIKDYYNSLVKNNLNGQRTLIGTFLEEVIGRTDRYSIKLIK